jgi:hypothetical protein
MYSYTNEAVAPMHRGPKLSCIVHAMCQSRGHDRSAMYALNPPYPPVPPTQGPAYLQSADMKLLGVLWATPMGLNLSRAAMYPDAVIQTSGWVRLCACVVQAASLCQLLLVSRQQL